MRCLRRLLGITWQDRIRNEDILKRAGARSMGYILKQKRLRWLGHICRMEDGRIPKDILFDKLATGARPTGRPSLRYKDVCKRDLKDCCISPADLQTATSDRNKWRSRTKLGCRKFEEWKTSALRKKKEEKKQKSRPENNQFTCTRCGRVCHSRIGLYSHSKRCRS